MPRNFRPQGAVAGLAEAVHALREELVLSMATAAGEDLLFELGTVTMDFAVQVTHNEEASAGIKFWVADVGARGELGHSAGHMVHLELNPVMRSGRRAEIDDAE